MYKKLKYIPIGILAFVALAGCTKSSDTPATVATNDFSSLPEVTGPVSSSAPSSFRASSMRPLAASTGVVLSTVATSTFGSGTSLAMCENVNYIKEILREASGPDKILCYMGKMKSTGVLPSSLDVADGNLKYVKLLNMGDSIVPRVKFQIVKTDGAVTTFKMWSCFSGTTDSPTQSEYISQTFSGTTTTIVTKNTGSSSGATYGSSMTTTGEFSNGSWSSKNIAGNRYYSDGSSSNGMSIDLDQYSDTVVMQIAMNGVFGTASFTNRFYTVAELLNGSSLSTAAIGDGSSKYIMSYDSNNDNSPEFSESSTQSWYGDSKANLSTASDGSLYTSANSGTVPSAPSATTVTFSGDEAWDCTAPSGEEFVNADFSDGGSAITDGITACGAKYLDSSSWVSCPY